MSIRKRTWANAKGEQVAWVVDYKDQNGKRRLKTFDRKKDAEAWWSGQGGYEVAQGIHTPASASVCVSEAGEKWLDHGRAEGLERSTIKQREQHIGLHINPFIGGVKLAELTTPRVTAFLDELRDADRSLAMRRKVLSSLKTLISHAQERGMVAQNVARGIRLAEKGREKKRVKIPTKPELRTIMEGASDQWRPLIVTAIFTGLRFSELRGLRWSDADLDGGVIHVTQRADQWGEIGAPKSKAGTRDVPLAPMVINALKEWRIACPKGELDLVFPNSLGKPQSLTNFHKRVYRPLLIECGITDGQGAPKYNLHALRHAAASLFIEQGWTPKKVQTVLGHASIQMTFDLYGHLFDDKEGDREAMERVEAALLAG